MILKPLTSTWLLIVTFLPILGIFVHCVAKVIEGEGQEIFKLGNVPIPKFYGAGATYTDILILIFVGMIALAIGIIIRWRHYKEEEDFKNKYGIEEKASFSDNLLDDLHKNDDL